VRALVVFVVVLMLSMLPRIAPAQAPSAEAEAHFKRGVTLYQEADFKAALVEFKRAYELSKNWRLLYNVARAENQAYDYAAALASFETYLREGGDRVPKARRVEVEQDLAKLRARVGKLTVRANVPDAIVAIDDEVLGKAPITHAVTVGSRRITVKKEGYAPWSQSVEIAGGDDRTVEAVLEAPSVAIASPAPAPPPPAPPPAKRFPWEAWTVTGVLTAAAVTTGIVALDAASSLDSAKGRFDVTDAELHDASKKVKTFGLVTDILAIGAIGSGVFSLYLTLKSPAAAPAIRVSPWPGGLSASGRF
jgi:tetratricopeptide (TPR) repeat protein